MATVQVVDLAGRENEQTSECVGDRMKELTFINRSLFQLANCVNALSKQEEEHVPFRNSKLTLLLSESFKRNSRTCLLATLTPSSSAYEDNLVTCRFLESTGRITTFPVANRFSSRDLQATLQDEITEMRAAMGMSAGDLAGELAGELEEQANPERQESLLAMKSREALLLHFAQGQAQDAAVGNARERRAASKHVLDAQDAKQALLISAYSRVGKSLNSAQVSLNSLNQANASIGESLGKAESGLSAVETRVQRMRSAGPAPASDGPAVRAPSTLDEPGEAMDEALRSARAAAGVKLPPLVTKVPVSFSVEMPEFFEFVRPNT